MGIPSLTLGQEAWSLSILVYLLSFTATDARPLPQYPFYGHGSNIIHRNYVIRNYPNGNYFPGNYVSGIYEPGTYGLGNYNYGYTPYSAPTNGTVSSLDSLRGIVVVAVQNWISSICVPVSKPVDVSKPSLFEKPSDLFSNIGNIFTKPTKPPFPTKPTKPTLPTKPPLFEKPSKLFSNILSGPTAMLLKFGGGCSGTG